MLATALAIVLAATGMLGSGAHPTPAATSAALTAEDRAADAAALRWLALADKGQWQESWSAAGASFRKAITAEGWSAQARPVRDPLGAVTSRSLAEAQRTSELPGVPRGDYYLLKYSTSFAKAPGVTETVVMEREGAGWRVVGYFIR